MAQLTHRRRRAIDPRGRTDRHRTLVAVGITVVAAMSLITSCGSDDTREVGPATTNTAATVPSSIPWDQSRDGLIETLTKMGLDNEQAACVVDRMDELDRRGTTKADTDRTQIEKLIQDCLTPG